MKSAWLKLTNERTNENYKSESVKVKSIPLKSEKNIQKQKQTNNKIANEKKVYD